jgi:hypothetical protein
MRAALPTNYFQDPASPGAARWAAVERGLIEGPEFTSAHLVTLDGRPDPTGIRSEVLFSTPQTWGYVPVPWGLPHPVWDLTTHVVPVLPLDARPLRRMPGGARLPGALDCLYQELLVARSSVVSYGASTPAGREAARRVRAYSAELVAVRGDCERADAREHGRFLPALESPLAVEAVPSACWSALGDAASGCAFLGSEHALLCEGQRAAVWDLHARRVTRTVPVPPLVLQGVVNDHAVFDLAGTPVLLDVRTGESVESSAVAVLGMAVQAGGAVVLQDAVRDAGVTLVEVGRSMAGQVFAPGRRWVWVIADDGAGAVYDVRTGLLVALREGARHAAGPHAMALDLEDRWCWVDGASVWRGEHCLGPLGEARATAFSADGTRLLIQRASGVDVVAMVPGLPLV